jgi:hypothetical protein
MGEVRDYRENLVAAKRWSKMDTGEAVIARVNGLPVTASSALIIADTSPCEYAPEWPFVAPEDDPA